jgi:hypothetical protein
MVKLFAWERKISDKLGERRNEELEWLKTRELTGLAMALVK